MEFNGSFGEKEFEEEEEINLQDLAKMKENDISTDNTQKYDDIDTVLDGDPDAYWNID